MNILDYYIHQFSTIRDGYSYTSIGIKQTIYNLI
jgi:hypothetical protein